MKTVLTEILDYLHLDKNYEEINENLQIHDIVYKINDLLKVEKQQIIDAFTEGQFFSESYYIPNIDSKKTLPESEQYFKETYEKQ